MSTIPGTRTAALGIALCLTWAPLVRADDVQVEGKLLTTGAKVVDLREGKLWYLLPSGRQISRPIEDVAYLQVTDWRLFNLAEKQHRSGDHRQAALAYERVLSDLTAPANQGDAAAAGRSRFTRSARARLVQCRLVRTYDAQGRFDKAVELYLAVIEAMPPCLETLRPQKLPAARSTFLQSARVTVEAAVQRHGNDPTARSLKRWLDTWPGRGAAGSTTRPATDPPIGRNATKPAPPTATDSDPLRRAIADIESLVKAGQYDQALTAIGKLEKGPAGRLRAELFYWRARARLGIAGDRDAPEAQIARRRAGLDFMRVVIHFPGHVRAAECLYRAGEICRDSGHVEAARQLWTELTQTYRTADRWTDRARLELNRESP